MPDLRVKILVFQQDGTVISQYLLGEGEHPIGRDPNSAIYCESAHISNDHAKLHLSDEGIFIEDLNSTSGTFLDQINVRGKVRLTPGQRLQVGDLHIDLQLEGVGDLSPGVKIGAGRYQLKKELGRGAMGQVWLAKDTQLDEYVAIKVLPSDVANDAVCLLDLKREVQKSRKLSHDNIIRIHDLIQLPGENPFVSLEFVQGTDLHAIQMNQSDRIFGWEEVKPYVLQLCDALDYAHERKIVHRDLKPANIMITNDGVLKLADFGIAASIADSTGRSSMADVISGTPQFMSPQQMLGEAPRASDDIYALGATMYCLLTGRPPFHTGDIAQQAQHITPAPLEQRLTEFGLENEVPGYVNDVVMSCLAKDAAARPASVGAIGEWLRTEGQSDRPAERKKTETGIERMVAEKPVAAAAEPAVDEQPTQAQAQATEGKKSPVLAIAAALIAVAALGWFFMGESGDEQENQNTGGGTQKASATPNSPKVAAAIEAAIRKAASKPTGEITQADWDKVTELFLSNNQLTEAPTGLEKLTALTYLRLRGNQLTDVKGLEKLPQLRQLDLSANQLTELPKGLEKLPQLTQLGLYENQLTDVKGLEKLTQLTDLWLKDNPALTKAQIAQLQKALPECKIEHNANSSSLKEGLVAYYPFNGNANDESGNGPDGTVNGASLSTDRHDKANNAYDFDGKSWIDLPQSEKLKFGAEDFTYSAWIKTSNIPDHAKIIFGEDENRDPFRLFFIWPSADRSSGKPGSATFGVRGSNGKSIYLSSPEVVSDGKWHHLIGTKNGSTFSLALNGKIIAQKSNAEIDSSDSGRNVRIGARHNQLAAFTGLIDDVRIYDRALSADEITALYDLEKPDYSKMLKEGLVAHYPFNGNANDESGNGNDGDPEAVTLTNDRHGKKDSAYSFEGPEGFISAAMPSDLAGDKPFTTSMWVNVNSNEDHQWLLYFGQQEIDKAFHIGFDEQLRIGYWDWRLTNNGANTGYALPINQWIHLMLTWDNNTLLTFINGEKIHETNAIKNRPSLPINGELTFGSAPMSGNRQRTAFDGSIDDVRIYNRALSAEEVSALYDLEKPSSETASGKKPGTLLWEFETAGEVHSSPAIGSDGTIYVGSKDGKVYALNGQSGAKKWEFTTGGYVYSSPTIGSDGTIYVGSSDNKIYSLDGATGVRKWEFTTGVDIQSSPAIGADDTVYVGSYDGKVYALNGKSGVKKWEFETGGHVHSSPAIGSDGTVYVGSKDQRVYALDGKTGAKKWEFETGDWVLSSPALGSDATLYAGGGQKKVYALDGATGVKIWEFRPGSDVHSSSAIGTDGTVYVGSYDNKVYALNGKTGARKWEFETGGKVDSSPAIGSDGTVYVGSMDNKVYALNGQTGGKQWEFETGRGVNSSPSIGPDGIIYIGSTDKKIYALATSSKGLADSPWPMFGQNAQHTGRASAAYSSEKIVAQIRVRINKTGGELTAEDMAKVKRLEFHKSQISDLSVLKNTPNLDHIDFNLNHISDLEPLSGLKSLKTAILNRNRISDLTPLKELTNLKSLDLYDNQIEDLSALSGLKQLTTLDLSTNPKLTRAQIDELQKALPNCQITHDAKK